MSIVRPAAVAGLFYTRDAAQLTGELREFLDAADADALSPGFPKVVIAPHAGYVYSGATAAHAYDVLRPARGIVKRVVMLGPCHRVPVRGMALPGAAAFDTPLGRVPVDAAAVEMVRNFPGVVELPQAHAEEHAIEVHLPFLQHVLGSFSLVPFVVGLAPVEQVAKLIEQLWGGEETLIVISSDLSHYHPYELARGMDGETARSIMAFDASINHEQACGAMPIAGALTVARRLRLTPRLLDLRNSGDTAGGRSRVVGYGSFSFGAADAYGAEHGHQLVQLAREAIAAALGAGVRHAAPDERWLREQRASFVTLKLGGRLRGCIGSLEPSRPLGQDVRANARAAALQDARFSPLSLADLEASEVELSVLSRPTRVAFEDHADLVRQLVPGRDGLILDYDGPGGRRRGTFLPQVWDELRDPETFLAHLKAKAGLPPDTRTTRCTLRRYRVQKWRESELRREA